MRAIWAMVGKDWKILLRDRMGFFFTFFFPLGMAIFFGTIFAGGGGGSDTRELSIAIVDEDQTPSSRGFAKALDDGPEFRAIPMPRDSAKDAVRLGRRTALLVLPKGFGEARQRMFFAPPATLQIGLDPSRKAEGGMIQGVLTKYLAADIQRVFAESGGGGGFPPARFEQIDIARVRRGPRNAYEVSFPQGVIWAILSTAFGFALSLVLERTRGTLVRLRVAPIPRRDVLLGKALGCLLTILIVSTTLLVIGALVFKVRPTSVPLLAAGLVSAAIGFVGIMMLISVISPSQRGVSGLGWAVMMVMSMTGGGMVPLFAMPGWMQSMSAISPVRWAILAIEGALWRDFTPAQMAAPCAVLLGIGIVGFLLGTRVFRWTEAA